MADYNPGAACGPDCGYCGACTKGHGQPKRCDFCREDATTEIRCREVVGSQVRDYPASACDVCAEREKGGA
jgi:hypothetical protein